MTQSEKKSRIAELVRNDPQAPRYHFIAPEGPCAPFDPNGAIFWERELPPLLHISRRGIASGGTLLGPRFEPRHVALDVPSHTPWHRVRTILMSEYSVAARS